MKSAVFRHEVLHRSIVGLPLLSLKQSTQKQFNLNIQVVVSARATFLMAFLVLKGEDNSIRNFLLFCNFNK